MCDHDSMDDMVEAGRLTRRQFSTIGLGAGFLAALPAVANAAEVMEMDVSIKTPDGTCDAHFAHPVSGAHAAVLVWPDIFGLRPAFRTMGKRLAESGYAVLTVNPFYRTTKAPSSPQGANMQDPATRDKLFAQMNSLTPQTQETDAKAFVAWLDAQKAVDTRKKIGTTGYCMGGPIVMRTAGLIPARIGAGASFHGANLNTDKADSPHLLIPKMKASPHLLIPKMKASLLIAIAQNDDASNPTSKDVLRKAFADAKVPAEIEVYPARHGWCAIDSQVYDKEQAEKAWNRMLALFSKTLA